MEKLKIGIIGTGGISQCHTEGYQQLTDLCEVVACCDIDEEKVKKYAVRYGIPRWYTDCREMMQKEKLDCVSVCTWNSAHKDCTIVALEAGANVLCEKPMAMNAAEAAQMNEAARRNGKLLQVGFVRRFGEDADTVINFAKAGMVGDVYYAKAQYLRRSGCPGGWFKDKRFSGGGPLIDLGVHVIDLARYLAGNPKPVSVYGCTYDNLGPNRANGGQSAWAIADLDEHPYNVEDFVSALIRFDNGFTMQLEASFNLNVPEDHGEVDIFGTKAGIKIEDDVEIYTDFAGKFVNMNPTGRTGFDFRRAFNAEIAGFVQASLGNAPCRASGEDGEVLMKIIDAIYESAEKGVSISIQ